MTRHELTARIAYEIFIQRGRVTGRHAEDWFAAEAIVGLCLAFATELARTHEPAGSEAPGESLEERALRLLQEAAEEMGRKAVASKLGYKSTSTVGRCLRGQQSIGEELAQRIVANLARPAPNPAMRRAA